MCSIVGSVVKSLSSHGLLFRGGDDSFESSGKNNGNFIMAMKLIAEYDRFLSKHILNYGNPGKGNTSIDLLTNGLRVGQNLLRQHLISKKGYFGRNNE